MTGSDGGLCCASPGLANPQKQAAAKCRLKMRSGFPCLFGSVGTDLRGPMRDGATDDELAAIIGGTWAARTDRYSEERASMTEPVQKKVEMYHIGG